MFGGKVNPRAQRPLAVRRPENAPPPPTNPFGWKTAGRRWQPSRDSRFGPEHLNSFDVVGNRDAEKIDRFEAVILSRLEDDTTEPDTHYLPLHRLDFGSVADLTE